MNIKAAMQFNLIIFSLGTVWVQPYPYPKHNRPKPKLCTQEAAMEPADPFSPHFFQLPGHSRRRRALQRWRAALE